ncbi:MAG TPA: TonB-dependent receptor [Novosphingobium sp.]|nr:TonB-dependent receptor [Novosphingobium sp.]
MKNIRSILLGASAMLIIASAPAAAQTVQPDSQEEPSTEAADAPSNAAPTSTAVPPASTEPVAEEATAGVQDIVVTATRRAANLQSVPATVSAFRGADLAVQGIRSVAEMGRIVPGLVVTRTAIATNLYLRGVGTGSVGYTTEAPVAAYIDGLYLPNPASSVFSFNNIERVEVLKGPQGTLYGRNTTGGLVHVITRDPGSAPRLDASIGYASYNTLSLNLYGSTPLSSNLSANVALTHTKQNDGWGTNQLLGTEVLTFRESGVQGKLMWEPGSDTRVTLRGMYVHVNTDQGVLVGIHPGAVGNDGTPYLGRYTFRDRRDGRAVSDLYLASLKVEQDVGFANLLSLTGYIDSAGTSEVSQLGVPGNPVGGQSGQFANFPGRSKTFSQELQLSSKNNPNSSFEWIGGLFYYHDNTMAGSEVFGTCIGLVCSGALPTRTIGYPRTRSYAVYGEGTYKVTPATRITLGLRYTKDNKSITGFAEPFPGRPNSPAILPPTVLRFPGAPFLGNPAGIDTSTSYSRFTYKAVIAHDLSDDIHLYASFNRGFRSGVYNPVNFSNQPTRPEVLDAFELGFKSDLFDRLLRLNLSAFRYNYRDIQLRTTAPPAPPGQSITFNAAEGRVDGVDLDLTLAPARGLLFTASAELLDAKFQSFPNTTCTTPRPITATVLGGNTGAPCDNSGKRFPNAPKLSFTLGASYALDTAAGTFTLAASDAYKSSTFWDPNNRLRQGSYHLVNASLTWTDPQERFDVQAFVRNISDTQYFVFGAEAGNDVYSPGAPRTYGVTVGFHY